MNAPAATLYNPLLLPEIREMLAEHDDRGLTEVMTELHPVSIAEFAEGLSVVPEGRWLTRTAVRPHPLLTFHGAESFPALRQLIDAIHIDESTAPQERPPGM